MTRPRGFVVRVPGPLWRTAPLNSYDLSVGVFIRGLTNLKSQLRKAEGYVAAGAGSEAALLGAQLACDEPAREAAAASPYDLHAYTLAAHVHWAAEGAKLAIGQVLGTRSVPAPSDATCFSDLYDRIDATIAYLDGIPAADLDAGFDRPLVFEHRHGSIPSTGGHFLLAFGIPHFFYHVTTAYGILRNQGVRLTMGDFLGNWGAA
jgi:uncharacterized protein